MPATNKEKNRAHVEVSRQRRAKCYQLAVAMAAREGVATPQRNNKQSGVEFDEWLDKKLQEVGL